MEQIPDRKKSPWGEYYEQIRNNPPTKLLVSAIQHVEHPGRALELGAGTAVNSAFLLGRGFEVTAVDAAEESEAQFDALAEDPHFSFEQARFEELDLPADSYDLISAMLSLPFIPERAAFDAFMRKIIAALAPHGVFAAHFFGPEDTWAQEGRPMTFVSRADVEKLLEGMEVLSLDERQEDRPTASGTPHHWHVIEVIAHRR